MSRNGNPLGNLKGKLAVEPVWKLHMTSVMARSTHESPPIQSQTSINGALPVFVLAFFIQTLFWFIFLAIFISVSQVCKIFHNSPWGIIHLRNRSLLLKMWACLHFSFSLSGIRLCSLKMSCIWSCYLWWIMSLHGYRYSRKQGSWTCFWWRRNQSGGVPYLFWKHACWYSW